MKDCVAVLCTFLVIGACSKPRTEAPMERQVLVKEQPAGQEATTRDSMVARPRPPEAKTAAYSYSIVEHATPHEMFADSTVTVLVKVRNTSDRAWSTEGPTKLGFYWTNEENKRLRGEEGRALLRKDTPPEAAVFFQCRVKAPATPGRYRLVWDMIEEKVAWFESKGVKPLRVSVTVL
ncbi:hypothetical protein JXA88_10560 [Candidatus Fermentibacteria bacterium]|nr:hypothetical protein [Candidatus Fermentibacteria bacterium]